MEKGSLLEACLHISALVLLLFLVFPVLDDVHATSLRVGNCTECHNETANPAVGLGAAKINVTAMNQSIHKDLNNDSTLILPDGAPNVTKACWACHGNGSQPESGTDHDNWPSNDQGRVKNPWSCTACHTNTTGGVSGGVGNYSAPVVYEHLNGTGVTSSANLSINTTAQCWDCHNKSVVYNNDNAGSPENNTNMSNVSHYGSNESLAPGGNDTTNCTTCHKNVTVALQWYLQPGYVNYTIRHSDDNATFCGKCHNSTNADNLHAERLYLPYYVHQRYDWEDDDDDEDPPGWKQESCFACHNESGATGNYPTRICEDCHINGSIGPYNYSKVGANFFILRTDWNESMPLVYEHIFENAIYVNTSSENANVTGVEVSTGNVSELVPVPAFGEDYATRNSTCLGWSNDTLEGFCHGVASTNTSDIYYAFSNKSADFNLTAEKYFPYYYNAPVDWLPDTTNCTYCHLGDASVRWQWGNVSYDPGEHYVDKNTSECYACHTGGSRPDNFHSSTVTPGSGPDCVACHDVDKSSAPDVDVSKMNASSNASHRNLNNESANTTTLTDLVDKACWACHGDGSQPGSHPSNFRTPKNCTDCHTNTTGGYNTSTDRGNYSAPVVYEHLNGTGVASSANLSVNTTAQCWDCHNNSVGAANDTENGTTIDHTARSNVSHYGTNESLTPGGYNTTNCTTCHMNATVALQWYLQQTGYVNYTIRHSENNVTFCGKCHNSTGASNFHTAQLYLPWYVHKEYDWEDDDDNEGKWGVGKGTGWKWESCMACHNTTNPEDIDPPLYPRRICEDCHINNSIGPYNKTDEDEFYLRGDWRESIPLVYEHIYENASYVNTTGDTVNVTGVQLNTGNVSALVPVPAFGEDYAIRNSTCLGWSNDTLEGFCHGVASKNTSDIYYAFSNKSALISETDFNLTNKSYYPYYYNAPVDWLPDTRNCTYCHLGDASVRWQWGNAVNISSSTKRTHTAVDTSSNSKCLECHMENGSTPYNFHSQIVNPGTEGGPDCVGCHDINRSSYAPDVDVSKINASSNSVHQNLSNTTANTTALADLIDKACWLCHGNGSQPPPGQHPSNYRNPLNCTDCHTNNTGGYNATTGRGNYSAPIPYEHLNATGVTPPPADVKINITAQCWECHTNGAPPTNDTESGTTLTNTEKSNSSHYGALENLRPGGYNSTYCATCHRNATVALKWGLRQTTYVNYTIRHGEDNSTFCGKCHNSTGAANLHVDGFIYLPWYVHYEYDWEDDDDNDGPPYFELESCFPCHAKLHSDYPPRICEDCHLNNSIGPYNKTVDPDVGFSLRDDWNESIPIVYEHIYVNATYNSTGGRVNVSGVQVSTGNVSALVPVPAFEEDYALRNSTCLGWSNDTQEGFCHGVASTNTSDIYYAFSNKSDEFNMTYESYYPYTLNAPVDWLPDTRNCTYCHLGDASVRWQWGNISYNAEHHYATKNNSECYECHVVGGQRPFNFHAEELHSGTGTCRFCHTDWLIMDKTPGRQYAFVNDTLFNRSVHGNASVINCTDCHTVTSNATANHTGSNYYPPQSGLRWCEDCHVANQTGSDPSRHNITSDPANNLYNSTDSVMNITNCTACHDANPYNNATAIYNKTSGRDCRFCHTFPDREPESPY